MRVPRNFRAVCLFDKKNFYFENKRSDLDYFLWPDPDFILITFIILFDFMPFSFVCIYFVAKKNNFVQFTGSISSRIIRLKGGHLFA